MTVSAENFGKPVTFDETNWNDASVKQVREQGKKALGGTKYGASKTLAEKAVWDFVSANPSLLWDIVTINPPFVFGPTTNHVPSPENLGTSATDWYKTLMTQHAGGKSLEFLATKCYSWIDVRDVAEAHVRPLAKEEAGGNRIIISTEPFCWQEFLDIALNTLTPSPYTKHPLARGNPGAGSSAEPLSIYRLDRAKQLLGMSNEEGSDWKYKTKEETTRDTLAEFAAKDW
ncbi:hypothetical protein E1B28_013774 [Marasmius oreades]|uniref:NAD-dependent epimerase/dehydratase domain-containing protein n=1 Tax=Marasmius oreades TaxID=181124 RepID=A0A9P7RQB0_9AGAR|nr:uncharacterized protein E1B28_013774 [Marasmius oreades]KAG7087836.1 hypothetical protein E1B28_013774 [Marasmius oreades]